MVINTGSLIFPGLPAQLPIQLTRSQLRIVVVVAINLMAGLLIWSSSRLGDGGERDDFVPIYAEWPGLMVPSHYSGDGGDRSLQQLLPDSHNTPPLFVLMGDSTTCGYSRGCGGWADGFLWLLTRGAEGIDLAYSGASSLDFRDNPIFTDALVTVYDNSRLRKVYVTLQFGHNDQDARRNISFPFFKEILVDMARQVIEHGGTPILVTPIARHDFKEDGWTPSDNLDGHREATKEAYQTLVSMQRPTDKTRPRLIQLNEVSLAYIGTIGKKAANRYNAYNGTEPDSNHYNEYGAVIYGRFVADLILGHPPRLLKSHQKDPWTLGRGKASDGLSNFILPNPGLSNLLWHGEPA